jgi:hypothetical protein
MQLRKLVTAGLAIILGVPTLALADTQSCAPAPCTTTAINVQLSLVIPSMVRFQLGAAAGSPTVGWTNAITAANFANGASISADSAGVGAGAGVGQVYYQLVSSAGTTVTLAAAGVGTLTNGTNAIPYTDITSTTTATTGAAVAMPAAGGTTTVPATGGIINRDGYWAYQFANTTVYPSGTYTGSINYTASSP